MSSLIYQNIVNIDKNCQKFANVKNLPLQNNGNFGKVNSWSKKFVRVAPFASVCNHAYKKFGENLVYPQIVRMRTTDGQRLWPKTEAHQVKSSFV